MNENLIRIKTVNEFLKDLNQEFVYVGGAIVSLYASVPPPAHTIRPTNDVDIVVELASYKGYADLDKKLRGVGFKNDIASGVICRYNIEGMIVDFMPTHPEAIGFSNIWYPEGFQTAINYQLDRDTNIRIFSLPYFVAAKWEAYKGRGKDYRTSRDFEDLVYVFEKVDDFEEKIKASPKHLRTYLHNEFKDIIDRRDFEEGLSAHLTGGYNGADPDFIRNRLIWAFEMQRNTYRGRSR